MPPSLSKSIKKSNHSVVMAKNRKLFASKGEDFWFCVALIVIIVGIAIVITYSLKNSNERYKNSDYFH